MSLNVGSLYSDLSLNIAPFLAGVTQAQQAARTMGSQLTSFFGSGPQGAINNTTTAVNKLGNQMSNVNKDLRRIIGGIVISQAFYRIINAIEDASASIMRFSNNMRTAAISLEYFLGSEERAKGFLEVMKEFAAWTPFSTEQALDQSRRLMAMGFAATEVKGVMKTLTDTASATGGTAEQMNRIVLALGQMRTNGYIAGQELRQLAEAGIPAYRILQEELGLTTDELRRIGKLKISGDLGVEALLRGLEKRYAGATERIAETVPGMWSTIKDDFLFISEELFKNSYTGLEGMLRKIRDGFEQVRILTRDGGIGAAFQKMISPEMQSSIRNILASLSLLGKAFKSILSIIGSFVMVLNSGLVQVFGWVLPPLAALISFLVRLIKTINDVVPFVRYLGAAIVGLLVAKAAAAALSALWTVTRVGTLCAVVARAVLLLKDAVVALTIALTKNPIVGLVMLLAGALLYLALSSATVSKWLSKVTAQLTALAGVSPDGLLNPEHNKELDKWMEEFNAALQTMSGDLAGVGENAEEAGKSLKDSFLSAFDEVYTIPDSLDEIENKLPKLKPFEPPEIPEVPEMAVPVLDHESVLQRMRELIARTNDDNKNNPIYLPPFIWPDPPTPPPIPIEPWVTTFSFLASKLGEFRVRLEKWAVDTGTLLKDWALRGWSAMEEFAELAWIPLSGFALKAGKSLQDWATQSGQRISEWATQTGQKVSFWGAERIKDFSQLKQGAIETVSTWTTRTAETIAQWGVLVETVLLSWGGSIKLRFAKCWEDLTKGLREFLKKTTDFWEEHKGTTLAIVGGGIIVGILTLFGGLPGALAPVLSTVTLFIGSAFVDAKKAVAATLEETKKDVIDKYTDLKEGLGPVLEGLTGKVTKAFESMKEKIKSAVDWMRDKITGFIGAFNNAEFKIPEVNIPVIGKVGGFTIGTPNIPEIPDFLNMGSGGIVKKNTLVRIAEKGTPEAAVPLTPEGLAPFISSIMQVSNMTNKTPSSLPPLYVHTLIADERGLQELERKLEIIRIDEMQRRGEK